MFNSLWYKTLNNPPLTPPSLVFPPVWTILYLSMLVALFFYMQNIGLALVVVIILDILVLWNIIEFFKVSKISGFILIPYFLWILFATYLNIGFLVLN